jgi:hypothetical protein
MAKIIKMATVKTPARKVIKSTARKVRAVAKIEMTPGQKAAATKALTGIQFAAGAKAAATKLANREAAEKAARATTRKAKVGKVAKVRKAA